MVALSYHVNNEMRLSPMEKQAKLFLHKILQNTFNIQVPLFYSSW